MFLPIPSSIGSVCVPLMVLPDPVAPLCGTRVVLCSFDISSARTVAEGDSMGLVDWDGYLAASQEFMFSIHVDSCIGPHSEMIFDFVIDDMVGNYRRGFVIVCTNMVALTAAMDGSKAVHIDQSEKRTVVHFSKMRRPERPNREALNQEISKVYEEINSLQARVEEINSLVNGRHQGKNSLSAQIVEARKRLSELVMRFKSIVDEKKAIREELEMADKARERMRQEARSLRDKLPYVRVEEIDEEIRRIEYRISHTSLTSQEEQRLIKQVSNFRKSRDFVQEYTTKNEKLTTDESSRSMLLEKIKEKDHALNEIKKQQEEERERIASLKEKESSQLSDIPALIEERSSAFDKIKTLREHISGLRSDFQLKEQEHWIKEKEWRQLQAMDRKLKFEKKEAEWKEREEIRRQKQLENYVPPYTEELIICDQLLSYLQKFIPSEKEASSAPQHVETVSHKGFENLQQIKKNRSDEDFGGWFSGTGSKGKPKKAKGLATGKTKERISLSIDALSSFEKVSLRPPLTVGDVPTSLIELKAKKEQYLKLQSETSDPREISGNNLNDSLQETTKTGIVNEGATSSSANEQMGKDEKGIGVSLVEETPEGYETSGDDNVVSAEDANGNINGSKVAIEEHNQVLNGDDIEFGTTFKVHGDQPL
eukprot:Gb_33313 [translate_table: standard]